jgi:four helix bundle protein
MNIAEGFRRFSHGDFRRFLRVALGSLEEAVRWIQDGIDRGYFTVSQCSGPLALGNEAMRTTLGIIRSLGDSD